MTLDEWAAEQCGVEIYRNRADGKIYRPIIGDEQGGKALQIACEMGLDNVCVLGDEWTLQDARCREIVREHFKLTTDQYGGDWASFPRGNVGLAIETRGNGKTIAEAEINCIQAIMEAS